ncbi:MAG: hypothetical protein K2J06_01835 [Muribaculaceae bacterium]|nr:hypothetical protein [Muribaculaceae bacterium]
MNYTRLFFIALIAPLILMLIFRPEDDRTVTVYFALMGGIVFIEIIYVICVKARERRKASQEKLLYQLEVARRDRAEQSYNQWLATYKADNGQPDIVFASTDYDLSKVMIINSSNSTIHVHGKTYPFSDILGYKLVDSRRIIPGTTTAVTERRDVIRRAVLGGMIADQTGAIIGALTAPETTTYYETADTVIHNYQLSISLNDIDHPIIRYKIGSNLEIAEEMTARLDIILKSNRTAAASTQADPRPALPSAPEPLT